jgi:hypothetical protein
MKERIDPQAILSLGLSFWKAKALLSAVELGLFTELARGGPGDVETLARRLRLHPRGARDFFDTLVALGMLQRQDEQYANAPEADLFLDRDKSSYIGGLLEMANGRLYPVWGSLTEALRSGQPQNEAKEETDYYANLCQDPTRLRNFLFGMTGLGMETSQVIAQKFPWERYRTFVDVGGAQGVLSMQLATAHQHLSGGSFDLEPIGQFFNEYIASFGLTQRLRFYPGDFFKDSLPTADVLIMGHILHNWNLEEKRVLIRKAFDSLPEGGVLLVYEALIDDDRRRNAFGLLMSLNMLLVTSGGFVYTGADCESWMREVGFSTTRVEHLVGPDSMVVATK